MAEGRREKLIPDASGRLTDLESPSPGGLEPWFRLRSVPGVGNLLFRRLMDRFQSPERAFAASSIELASVEGVSERLAAAIHAQPLTDAVRKELAEISRSDYSVVTMNDPGYPGLLLQIPDPPPFLYVHGALGDCSCCIAVVGARNATAYGRYTAEKLCREMAGAGITVVSGLARGIDTAAHRGALAAGGRTIAVLGTGLARIYPEANRELVRRIAASGAVITEFPLKAGPDAHHFPVRNRIISGVSLGTVVVEAARKSGSLITARLSAEQNREVFAVPGNVHSAKSAGTHYLIKQGAKLVETAADILEELPAEVRGRLAWRPRDAETASADRPARETPPLTPEEARIAAALGPDPIHIDLLVRSLGMDPGTLSALLMRMELKGAVIQAPGKMFSIERDHGTSIKRQG